MSMYSEMRIPRAVCTIYMFVSLNLQSHDRLALSTRVEALSE